MDKTEHRTFATPDETREFPNGHAEILNVGGGQVGRLVFRPGWRWSADVRPIAGTASCEAPHFQYHVSGRLAIRMDDGAEDPAHAARRLRHRGHLPGLLHRGRRGHPRLPRRPADPAARA